MSSQTTSTSPAPSAAQMNSSLETAKAACKRIAPLWPLQNFVAVNPFLGLADQSFVEACDLIRKVAPGGMQMPLSFYSDKFNGAEITGENLSAALDQAQQSFPSRWKKIAAELDVDTLIASLNTPEDDFDQLAVLTVADALDQSAKTRWNTDIIEVVSQFCASYYDRGQSAWKQPWLDQPLYIAWRETASLDAKPECLGLKDFRKFVINLPESPAEAIDHLLKAMGITSEDTTDFLHRQLMSIRGWAGHVQYLVREREMAGDEDDALLHLLAIRLAYDAALLSQFDSPSLREFWDCGSSDDSDANAANQVVIRFLWQLAHEDAWQRKLFSQLLNSKTPARSSRPTAQAVFCIDVRSEVFRRSLEAASDSIQTMGFAGFFGMAIEYVPFGQKNGNTQCPVLLNPAYKIREIPHLDGPADLDQAWKKQRLSKRLQFSWNSFKNSAISCFSFVETAGVSFAPTLFKKSFAPSTEATKQETDSGPTLDHDASEATGIPLDERIALGTGALSHMGLKSNFARLVLICGHGSETTNNPYGAGLDCGACGGHAGDANARVAVAILNDPKVREGIAANGIAIPEDTIFLAGLHNTTTDDVTVFGKNALPQSHTSDLQELEDALKTAGKTARLERATSLGLSPETIALDQKVRVKAHDWSEVRPEWGLAGNAAFIAAPRHRTQDINLGGRVFLHDYEHRNDTGEATLELILSAPMVVGSWINLQYFASTVNNRVFGSGNKVTHNVTGTLGVCQGNVGDLETGLPIQSVHDGEKWIHEPLRLHVLVEAPRASIETILEKHPGVKDLVTNGWVLLFAIEEDGKSLHQIR